MGFQDQYGCVLGGFLHLEFWWDGDVWVNSLDLVEMMPV